MWLIVPQLCFIQTSVTELSSIALKVIFEQFYFEVSEGGVCGAQWCSPLVSIWLFANYTLVLAQLWVGWILLTSVTLDKNHYWLRCLMIGWL
jgi:hypothetical protein